MNERSSDNQAKITSILVMLYRTTDFNPNYYFPLSLHYLKAYSKKALGCSVSIAIENYSVDDDSNQVVFNLLKDSPDVIGFSCYVWNIREVLETSYLIKKLNPAIQIVLGGPQVTHTADTILADNEWVDVVVRGEGEETFADLLKYYLSRDRELGEINGISYRADGVPRSNPARALIKNLDDIPSPFEEGIEDQSHNILMETQRGCPFECAFCDSHKGFKSVRYFSLERVKEDLNYLISSGVKRLFLADSTFNLDRNRAKEILRHIVSINKDTDINTELRAELLDGEMVYLLEKAGVKFVEFGLQSTSPTTAKNIGRETDLSRFEKGIRLLEKSKIQYVIQLIIGLPGDDLDSFKNSMDYVLNLAPTTLQAFELQLLPGTALYLNAAQHGMLFNLTPPHLVIQSHSFSYTDMMKAKQLSREAFLMYPRNYALLTTLTEVRPSELIEKWVAWRGSKFGLSFDDFEKLKGMKRLLMFSRFIQELLLPDGSSTLKKLSIKVRCNLRVSLIVFKYLNKVIRRSLPGR